MQAAARQRCSRPLPHPQWPSIPISWWRVRAAARAVRWTPSPVAQAGRDALRRRGGRGGLAPRRAGANRASAAGDRSGAGGAGRAGIGPARYARSSVLGYSSRRASPVPRDARLPAGRPGEAREQSPASPLSQGALFDQLARTLAAISREQPLLLLLDDLHWVDDASTAFLLHIAASSAQPPARPRRLPLGDGRPRPPRPPLRRG